MSALSHWTTCRLVKSSDGTDSLRRSVLQDFVFTFGLVLCLISSARFACAFIAGFAFGFGGRHEHAIHAPFAEMSGDDNTGGASFVADFEIGKFDVDFCRKFLESLRHGGDASGALSMVGGVLAPSAKSVGAGNCFLVDIESDVVGVSHGVFRYLFNVG